MWRKFFIVGFVTIFFCIFAAARMPQINSHNEQVKNLVNLAQSGDSVAIYRLAWLLDTGYDDLLPDSLLSGQLYQISADAGYLPAMNYLGFRIMRGEGGMPRDSILAKQWIRKAALQGYVPAMSNLGFLLLQSPSDSLEIQEGVIWVQEAARNGLPAAVDMLADLYRSGTGLEKDTLLATQLYEQAMEAGVTQSQYKLLAMNHNSYQSLSAEEAVNLGIKYYQHGAPVVAIELFEQAAEKGNPQAMALLGDAYSRGKGDGYDHEKSLNWYFHAAKAGNPSAAFVLAELLDMFPDALLEIGVDNADNDAQFWYQIAKEQGIENARQATEALYTPPRVNQPME